MGNGRFSAPAALLAALLALFVAAGAARAQTPSPLLRIEARFLDKGSGAEVGWGATGQVVVPPQPGDPAFQRWWQAREVATSPARQSVTLAPPGRGLIRVGRDIPFAGWFLRHGTNCGWLEAGTEWREVESALEVEASAPAADGTVHVVLTPEFSYLSGRSRRVVAFPGERVDIALTAGVEARFVPGPPLDAFYGRLFSGYDPLRRVWPVVLILRADRVEPADP